MEGTYGAGSSTSQSPNTTLEARLDRHSLHAFVKYRFVTQLSQCLYDFVLQLLPTAEEMSIKEDVRKLLERLIRTIEPDSRLLSFGSTANGFSLRNSDMDLCCLIDSDERLAASDLVTMLGDLLERETKFHVKPLPHARIPIVKLSLDPSPGLPLGIACDIGFENRLALENTRLLMCYAMIDPTRVRTMVLFLKVWSKRRKINSPYQGTLSSYGYVLMVLYFLIHVKNPPVLPNLQQMPPLRPISPEDTHVAGYNTWFFDDIELLRQRWQSSNAESVAELLIDFFRYYSRDFLYNTGVASIRAGLLKKESKGWQNDLSGGRYNDARERNRFCIEDPFEVDYNVSRCVTRDGLYTIRGEFMRASRVLATRPDRAIVALAELCEERKEEALLPASPVFTPPQISSLPPQTPYTVGANSHSLRPNGPVGHERLSPKPDFFEPGPPRPIAIVPTRTPPEHMAPIRSKWTSPPPPEAPSAAHTLFEDQLGLGLELATSSTDAREREVSYNSSSSNSEYFTDEEPDAEGDVKSARSAMEGPGSVSSPIPFRRPSWLNHGQEKIITALDGRGRLSSRTSSVERPCSTSSSSVTTPKLRTSHHQAAAVKELARRSSSGPPRPPPPPVSDNTVFYETKPPPLRTYPSSTQQQQQQQTYPTSVVPHIVTLEPPTPSGEAQDSGSMSPLEGSDSPGPSSTGYATSNSASRSPSPPGKRVEEDEIVSPIPRVLVG